MSRLRFGARPRVIDMFSGAGLFSYAFAREGFELIQAVEIDPAACETYRRNLGDHVITSDIRGVEPVGDCEVIIAGPPCQGFSTLGKRRTNDPRNALSLEVLKWAELSGAKVVVIENVPAFLESSVWLKLGRRFSKLGYEVTSMVLNAVDFGVPQHRSRSFTIASKIGTPSVRRLRGGASTVREAFAGLGRPSDGGTKLHRVRALSPLAYERIKGIPPGGDKRDLMRTAPQLVPRSWWEVESEATDVWGRMKWDEPSNTLRTCFINPSKGRYIHPAANRVITLREAARLHSIPDDWEFHGFDSWIARHIGNSVPPRMGRAVARGVAQLFGPSDTRWSRSMASVWADILAAQSSVQN